MEYSVVIDFWFGEITPEQWWQKDHEFDRLIERRFGAVHRAAVQCELYPWREHPQGRVAEIIVLDQFSRNIYRDLPLSFASDAMALCLAQEAIRIRADAELSTDERIFCYMPFMHSESRLIHEQAVQLYTGLGEATNIDFELQHKAIIDRFGRYPHRNEILSRPSTEEERAFLEQPDSSF